MKNMNFPRAGELHRRTGRQAAQQASGLHIKLAFGKERARGLPISAARPGLFRNPPNCLFVQPALLSSVQPAESSRFSFGNTALRPSN